MKVKFVLMSALSGIAVGLCVAGCHSGEKEHDITLTEVPQSARDAAMKAVAGITLTKAEIEEKASGTIYELKGEADGKKYKIKVTPEGKVIKCEKKDSEDKDDDGDKNAKK